MVKETTETGSCEVLLDEFRNAGNSGRDTIPNSRGVFKL
jgi:hypothetical protein